MILGIDSRKRWSKWDIVIAEAYQILRNELCQNCGLPKYICHSESSDIQFDISVDKCFAKEALGKREEFDEKARTRTVKGQKVIDPAPPGESLFPTPYTMSGASLGSFRESYYDEMAKIREAKISTRPRRPATE